MIEFKTIEKKLTKEWYKPPEIIRMGIVPVCERTFRDHVRNGRIKAVNSSDSARPWWVIHRADIIAYIKSFDTN